MVDNDEMKQRVLAEMYETHFENVYALANSIFPPTGDQKEVIQLKDVLSELVSESRVQVFMNMLHPHSRILVASSQREDLIRNLTEWFVFDQSKRRWTLRTGDLRKDPIPEIGLTPAGIAASDAITLQRPFRWWRKG